MNYPLYFKPVYKDYIWGKETWEVSDRDEGMSVVENGPLKGKSLHELMKDSQRFVGESMPRFPLLLKWIDAAEDLSIQVHPNEEAAELLHSEPKTEMWYVLEEGFVFAGFQEAMTKERFEECLKKGRAASTLKKIAVQPHDALYIPAGTVHAVLSGCFFLEIQQNSNTTYRLDDWGRGRPLHLVEGLQSIEWKGEGAGKVSPKILYEEQGFKRERLLQSPYFEVERIHAEKRWVSPRKEGSFEAFVLLQGKASIHADDNREDFLRGRVCLCPAACKEIVIEPESPCRFLRVTL